MDKHLNATLLDLAESYPAEAFAAAHTCPICSGPSTIIHSAFNIDPAKNFRFKYRACKECAHGWVDPMPSQGLLSYLYGRGSHSVVGVGWTAAEESELSIPGKLVNSRELNQRALPRCYFELGVGKGLLYRRFLDNGWHCRGVEPGYWGRALSGVFDSLVELPETYAADVIVALDVLEHVSDPLDTLRRLRLIAKPGARLYAAMPNRESLRARLGRQRWRMLRPLGHVNYWSRKSLARAFAISGFVIEEMHKTDLWDSRPIDSLRTAVDAAIERLGLGDQWIVIATPN
jgi:SAM-dependent methyltransferase